MVAQALQESLGEYERQGKDGRNVVVKQFRARLARVCECYHESEPLADPKVSHWP
jgi:hypothetical protein